MTNRELADLMYPNVTKTIEDYEMMYPKRNLPNDAIVTRFAPSPTGFVHMGSLLTTFIGRKVADDTNGIFYLRIEDTDQKREVENGIEGIVKDLTNFNIKLDEGALGKNKSIGEYGPYIQSERREIYDTFVKYMIANDLAYPCFCKSEELDKMREMQESAKLRIGYYGSFAKCRSLTNDEVAERIKNGEKYTIRIKSRGDFNKKILINDLVRGKIEFPSNDIDYVLVKSDGMPLYHMAHLVDDHLMRTTHVLRGEEWFSSTPLHIELFKMFNFEIPKYAHLGLVMKIDENGKRRKLSKRLDSEASASFYEEKGIPVDAIKSYLLTIANSNYEEWLNQNPDKSMNEFKLDFKKISLSGSLYDIEKLLNISKNYLSRLNKDEIYNNLLKYTSIYDKSFHDLITTYADYTKDVLNIERCQKKPRKDYDSYSSIKEHIWYMYDELFNSSDYEFTTINDKSEISLILEKYSNEYYDLSDKETWFNKIKDLASELGYCTDMKEYKENPNQYKGSVGDIAMVLRVAITTKSMTPDLYEIMKLLGKNRINDRFKKCIE